MLVLPVLSAPEEVFQEYGPRRRRRDVFGEQGSGREFSVQGLHDRGLLMFGRRGEPLDEVIERFTKSSGRARGLTGNLSQAIPRSGTLPARRRPAGRGRRARL
ncbi:hypothetical protein [Streptomyces sp. NPDC056690]|uniref:hypothetical protein n=1 Tax=unclassified Streptomyces TaxID=2593676 RepID=UPI0036315EDA